MSNSIYKSFISKFLFLALIVCGATAAFAQTTKTDEPIQTVIPDITEFTYQGRLLDTNLPANGTYDFQFRLTDGEAFIGTPQLRPGVQVVNGIFTVRLDFGRSFPAGQARFLEIGIKPVGIAAYTTLSPNQPVTATPYAVHSADASFANFAGDSSKLGGMTADQFVLTGDARLSDDRNPLPGSNSYIQNTYTPQSANFNVSGDGTIGGNLSVGGTTSFNVVNAQTQYNFGGQRFLSGNAQNGNIFAGFNAGNPNATGGGNSFFGYTAGTNTVAGNANSFFGSSTGTSNTTGSANSFFGAEAGRLNTTGYYNTSLGYLAGEKNLTGIGNTLVGAEAGRANLGNGNSFFGLLAGTNNTTGNENSFFGDSAGRLSTTGIENAFFGYVSGNGNTTGSSNAAVGAYAGYVNAGGNQNAFFGARSGFNSTGSNNAFFGYQAGLANTTGSSNTVIGAGANLGAGNLTFATAIGAGTIVNSSNTIALGRSSGADTIFVPGNLTVGGTTSFNILNAQTQYNLGGGRILSGDETNGNIYAGFDSGTVSTGANNSFFGFRAGRLNTSGFSNVFLGASSGEKNTTGYYNTAVGIGAGSSNTTGIQNSYFGFLAGSNSTGSNNAFFGTQAGSSNTTGSNNVFIGQSTGFTNTTGNNITLLGSGANVAGNGIQFGTALGAGAVVESSNQIVLGRSNGDDDVKIYGSLSATSANFSRNVTVDSNFAILNLSFAGITSLCYNQGKAIATCSSSIRYKKDVENFTSGLDLIRRLRPVAFTWKDGGMRDLGFIAEEVNAVEPLMTTYNDKGEVEGVKYDRISTALVNAVNEQQTEIESQQTEIRAQKKQINDQQTLIQNQQRQLNVQQKQIDALMKLVCPQNAAAEVCREKEL